MPYARVALTGPPLENHLGDLWSLFDFLCPDLPGTASQSRGFTRRVRDEQHAHFGPLPSLGVPYILHPLKIDRTVIDDLREKTEVRISCGLSTAQARLYRQTAARLQKDIERSDGIERRGLVLAYLMRLSRSATTPASSPAPATTPPVAARSSSG